MDQQTQPIPLAHPIQLLGISMNTVGNYHQTISCSLVHCCTCQHNSEDLLMHQQTVLESLTVFPIQLLGISMNTVGNYHQTISCSLVHCCTCQHNSEDLLMHQQTVPTLIPLALHLPLVLVRELVLELVLELAQLFQ